MKAHPSRARRIAYAIARRAESHDRRGAQVRGAVWPGRALPRALPPVDWAGYVTSTDPAILAHNEAIDARQPELAVSPRSPLAVLLAQLNRSDRRLLLATVQAADTPRRARMQRQTHRRLRALGLER